jgi:hypothetical protein
MISATIVASVRAPFQLGELHDFHLAAIVEVPQIVGLGLLVGSREIGGNLVPADENAAVMREFARGLASASRPPLVTRAPSSPNTCRYGLNWTFAVDEAGDRLTVEFHVHDLARAERIVALGYSPACGQTRGGEKKWQQQ